MQHASSASTKSCKISIWIVAALVGLFGLFFTIGGAYLLTLGGSLYFVISGILLLVSAVLLFKRKTSGIWVYIATMVYTLIWSLIDAGFHFWPLFSRLFSFGILSVLVGLIYPMVARASGAEKVSKKSYAISGILALASIAAFAYTMVPAYIIAPTGKAPEVIPVAQGEEQQSWPAWAGDDQGSRFAKLDQINKSNIKDLGVAWTAHTGDIPQSTGAGAEDQNTPLQIGDTLYVCTPYSKVIALDVDTGKEKWRFDAQAKAPSWQRCRGVGYYADEGALPGTSAPSDNKDINIGNAQPAVCSRRIFLPTIDARLIALNADNGQPCADFGKNGVLDLTQHMGDQHDDWYQQTSAPLVAGNVVVVGGRVADNWATDEPPGVVRAFDVHTGEIVWAFDSGNENTHKLPPEGQDYTHGAPNSWAAMSYDPKLNLVYIPTGNTTPDFFGGQRTPTEDKYSSSIVAVDAKTGIVRWHFQTTHHDLWDFDLPAQPLLTDVPDENGKMQPALIQVTKQGEIFVLNRETGVPITKVVEKPVPQGNLPGERYSPTQPFSVGMPSIGNTTLTESDMWGATPFDQLLCRINFKKARHQGVYTPPGLDYSIQMPGSLGGMNWGSVSVDPTSGYMFVNDMRLGLANYQIPRDKMPKNASGIEMGAVPMDGTPYGAMRMRFLSELGIPCQKPPFGTMTAINLKTKQIAWQVPVGTVQDTGPMGIRMHLPMQIGMPTLGPSLATQSGIVFFAGTQDFYLRAFDSATGKVIWKARLPVGSQSGPMTYVSPKTGKQYVVINAGGARQSPDRGDYIIAYALKDN